MRKLGKARRPLNCSAKIELDQVTFAGVLNACSDLPTSIQSQQIHAFIIKTRYASSLLVENSLIDAYAQNDDTEFARQVKLRLKCEYVSYHVFSKVFYPPGHIKHEKSMDFERILIYVTCRVSKFMLPRSKSLRQDGRCDINYIQAWCSKS